MDPQAEAERQKKKVIFGSEGVTIAEGNRSLGLLSAQAHATEAMYCSATRGAEGGSKALRIRSLAKAEHIFGLAMLLREEGVIGATGAGIHFAEAYLSQIRKFAKKSNTIMSHMPVTGPIVMISRPFEFSRAVL